VLKSRLIFRFDNKNSEKIMGKMGVSVGLVLGVLLAGCGGGGDSSSGASGAPKATTPTVLRAEGAYTGTLSNGQLMETVILESGEIFMMHGDFKSLNGQAMIEGPGKEDNGSYSATETRDYDPNRADPFVPAPISASYDTAGRFSGTISEQGQTISFTGARPATSIYDYDQPASLDRVVGTWSDFLINFAITAAGEIHLSSRQCDGSGTIKPRASGKNVFDIEWTFVAIPACPFYGQTVKSIAFVEAYTPVGSTLSQRIIIMGVDNARTKGKGWYFYR
jgi:hypothetical protein